MINNIIVREENVLFQLRDYQQKALDAVAKVQSSADVTSTLLSMATGSGKTVVGSINAMVEWINKGKRAIWITPSIHLALQAVSTFKQCATKKVLPNQESFNLAHIGTSEGSISEVDDSVQLLICTYQFLVRHLDEIEKWCSADVEYVLYIDECHHACSKSHVTIINKLKKITSQHKGLSIVGLTATPFRTSEKEQGALSKIFTDGLDENGNVVHGDLGIAYSISLIELIAMGHLAKPIIEDVLTDYTVDAKLGYEALSSIQSFDEIPAEIANMLAESIVRNTKIVETYKKNMEKYRQTIVFCVNQLQAVVLKDMFENEGIKVGLAISVNSNSKVKLSELTKNTVNNNIEEFRNGNLQVLLTCCMLNEGFDVPKTKTVFLCRPTTSKIVLSQSIGRALRPKNPDNTAYIVNFIDDWETQIAWVNPRTLFTGNGEVYYEERNYNSLPSVSVTYPAVVKLLEELEDKLDSDKITSVDFKEYVPIGFYNFTYIDEVGKEVQSNILVYKSNKMCYEQLFENMKEIFDKYNIGDYENIPADTLSCMVGECLTRFFSTVSPTCYPEEMKNILSYYAVYDTVPIFKAFSEDTKVELDLSEYAKQIVEEDMRTSEEKSFLRNIWDTCEAVRYVYSTFGKFERLVHTQVIKFLD